MIKSGDLWQCKDCLWATKYKTRLWEHVEAKHVQSAGYCCPYCNKFCSSKNAWKQHKSKFHSGIWWNKRVFLSNTSIHLCLLDAELETAIAQKMGKLGELWQCQDCLWTTRYKTRLWEHIEAKHVKSGGYTCPLCNKFCPSKNAWHLHKSRYHKGYWNKTLRRAQLPVEHVFV